MQSRIPVGLLAGAIGGALGWLLQENLIPYEADAAAHQLSMTTAETRILVVCVGGMIGLFLGAIDGVVEGSARKVARGMALGAVGGILFGAFGFGFGNSVYNRLGGSDGAHANANIIGFATQVVARSVGWAFMGLGLEVGSSLATGSPKRIRNGAIGGFLGGLAGGFVFDIIGNNVTASLQSVAGGAGVHDVGGMSRAIGFTAIGGLSGLFIGLVDELLKQAWVKVLVGRNEGKEFILTKHLSILGRDERCDAPLFGDPNIGAQHLAIRADGARHVLIDGNTPLGTVVNGQRVPSGGELLLRDGDMI